MKKIILLTVLVLLISLAYSFAEVPCKINYQGRLIKDNVPVDGTKTMKFSIYNEDNDLLWTSTEVDIIVYNGLFRYVLDLSSIDDWTAGETLYLEVQVGTDILTPREAIYAYPYAINSHLLEGRTTDYFLNTSEETQKKDGGLNIMGNVGIGTTSPDNSELDIQEHYTTPSTKLEYVARVRIGDYHQIGETGLGNIPYHAINARLTHSRYSGGAIANRFSPLWYGDSGSRMTNIQYGISTGSNIMTVNTYNHGTSGAEVDWGSFSNVYSLRNDGGAYFAGNVGIGTTGPEATLEVKGTVKMFGSWASKSNSTVYKAASDGFVCVINTALNTYVRGYTDGNNPPVTMRAWESTWYAAYASFMMPVRKGDYWRVTGATTVYWIPLGS